MIDLKLLQKDFENVSAALMRKKVSPELIDELKARNEALKTAKAAFEEVQAAQNEMSRLFPQYKKEGKDVSELKAKLDAARSREPDSQARTSS